MNLWAIEARDGALEPRDRDSVPWLYDSIEDAEVKAAHLCEMDSDATGYRPAPVRLERGHAAL